MGLVFVFLFLKSMFVFFQISYPWFTYFLGKYLNPYSIFFKKNKILIFFFVFKIWLKINKIWKDKNQIYRLNFKTKNKKLNS